MKHEGFPLPDDCTSGNARRGVIVEHQYLYIYELVALQDCKYHAMYPQKPNVPSCI